MHRFTELEYGAHFREKINFALSARDMTAAELIRAAGFMKNTYYYWGSFYVDKNGMNAYRPGPGVTDLSIICEVLDCDMEYFLTDRENLRQDIVSAAEITGLSPAAIDALRYLAQSSTDSYNPISRMNAAQLQTIDRIITEEYHDAGIENHKSGVTGGRPLRTSSLFELISQYVGVDKIRARSDSGNETITFDDSTGLSASYSVGDLFRPMISHFIMQDLDRLADKIAQDRPD